MSERDDIWNADEITSSMFRNCRFVGNKPIPCPTCGEEVAFLYGDGDLWSPTEPAMGLFLRCGACKALFDGAGIADTETPPHE